MRGVNKVILVGNLGKDPEVQYLESGIPLARLALATNERYKDKEGNWQDQTEWHRVVLWRGLAEVAEKFLKKGNQVYIEGKLNTRSWDDKDGNKRYTTEIVGDNMVMLDRKGEGGTGYSDQPAENQAQEPQPAPSSAGADKGGDAGNDNYTDDLPF